MAAPIRHAQIQSTQNHSREKGCLHKFRLLIKKIFAISPCWEAGNKFLQWSLTGFINHILGSSWPTENILHVLLLCFLVCLGIFVLLCMCVHFTFFNVSVFTIMFHKFFWWREIERERKMIFMELWEVEEYHQNVFSFIK